MSGWSPASRTTGASCSSAPARGRRSRDFLDRTILRAQDQLYREFSAQELAELDRLQKKMLHNLSELTQSDCKEEL